MNDLLTKVLDAHGGLERWRSYNKVEATIVAGGGFFALKGVLMDADPRRLTVWFREERATLSNFGGADQHIIFTPGRIAVEKLDGTIVAERFAPKDSFAGHQMHTPWDPLHLAYFNGEALWTYLATPFAFAMDGVHVEETTPWQEGEETWRVLRVYFPGSIGTHCEIQEFFYDEKFELRRHDYSVNIAGGFPAAQLMLKNTQANGIRLPSRRRAYTRGPDRRPILDMLMVSMEISDVAFS